MSWSAHVRAVSSAFCAEGPSRSSHASRVTTAQLAKRVPSDKAAAICEILNIWITNSPVSQVWPAGEHLIHNL
jgi:hypothetical protein